MLANGSMSSNTSEEGDILMALIEADLVDCMMALPGQLFYGVIILENGDNYYEMCNTESGLTTPFL